MTSVLIVGGKLQGIEISYLASCAGYSTTLVDKNPNVPAVGLVDAFEMIDACDMSAMLPVIKQHHIIMPALEDTVVLERLYEIARMTSTPIVYDPEAYRVSKSKKNSNALFEKIGVPVPPLSDGTEETVIIKPDDRSGSQGIRVMNGLAYKDGLDKNPNLIPPDSIIQRFIEGPSYSMEVIGSKRGWIGLPITEVLTGDDFDCVGINAPASISPEVCSQFEWIAKQIADSLAIDGIFDIEVIEHEGQLYVLEIDARFPSQTPISVYHATGINMVSLLCDKQRQDLLPRMDSPFFCLYRHIRVSGRRIETIGEHALGQCGVMTSIKGFAGADVAITDYREGKECWCCIVVVTHTTFDKALKRFQVCLSRIERGLL